MKNNKPIHEVKIGAIKAEIWEADGVKGPFFSVVVCRLYKVGNKWEEAKSISGRDISKLREVLRQVNLWLLEHEPESESVE